MFLTLYISKLQNKIATCTIKRLFNARIFVIYHINPKNEPALRDLVWEFTMVNICYSFLIPGNGNEFSGSKFRVPNCGSRYSISYHTRLTPQQAATKTDVR